MAPFGDSFGQAAWNSRVVIAAYTHLEACHQWVTPQNVVCGRNAATDIRIPRHENNGGRHPFQSVQGRQPFEGRIVWQLPGDYSASGVDLPHATTFKSMRPQGTPTLKFFENRSINLELLQAATLRILDNSSRLRCTNQIFYRDCLVLRCRCRPDPRRSGVGRLDVFVGLPIN
jgi:hypothetical protein